MVPCRISICGAEVLIAVLGQVCTYYDYSRHTQIELSLGLPSAASGSTTLSLVYIYLLLYLSVLAMYLQRALPEMFPPNSLSHYDIPLPSPPPTVPLPEVPGR
ncbi:hypothetical protein F5050DRAFT_1795901 [Lentinula boryana]|uniref:Uncharacterized protein n=1 Tax=Lentinula boryana TaxID=40481 RepID=A0ABQ8PYP7_9AGAR|nr:hypothetical protein F5050DRAFT_1795901 [Lentinula boryana]